MALDYDQTDAQSIEKYSRRLINKSLRNVKGVNPLTNNDQEIVQSSISRGSFGNILEERYFGIHPGNSSLPDFSAAGVELKSLPIKKRLKGGHQAKERLVLNIINYEEEATKDFMSSSFMSKSRRMLLIGYLYEQSRNVVDFEVKLARLLEYDGLPEDERMMIRSDWEKISKKIREGKAHELSEGDTFLLGACTKAATSENRRKQANGGPLAKPRAFSLKQGYMTRLVRRELGESDLDKDEEKILKGDEVKKAILFEKLVEGRFTPFIGRTINEIHFLVGRGLNKKSKNYLADLSRRMMGVKKQKIVEFENAGVVMKTIQLTKKGAPKESMSFPAFKYKEIINQKWDGDEEKGEIRAMFQEQIERKFFFVIFKCDKDCKKGDGKRLGKVMFWTMPASDLEEAQHVWEETTKRIAYERAGDLPKSTESAVVHVRPHGRNKKDTDMAPDGKMYTKKCFWLNRAYLGNVINKSNE